MAEAPDDPGRCRDREAEAGDVFAARVREQLQSLVTPALVEEHRQSPVGRHSPALSQVLAYLRQRPTAGKLALLTTSVGREWVMIRLSGQPGLAHEVVGRTRYTSEEEALHAVFLRRLAEMGVDGHLG